MIDIAVLKRAAGDRGRTVELTSECLEQIISELEAGRRAQEKLGQAFGLPQGAKL